MNNKGQFSIIAALFVAVILISTVIITFSTIRSNPVPSQPNILNAIDETNLALKQMLGFTVGYFGSILQVTGNSSYARMLAVEYLYSGIENIGNIHPEWGPSFNLSNSEFQVYWFANESYSSGSLAVTYNLTGLSIYGITYTTSSRIDVKIINTTSINQARLTIIKDEEEPLVILGRQNFKFYRYSYSNSTWELVNPSSEPIAFANGTYLIDLPSGIDPYNYQIQVEDPRGIMVVASTSNSYVYNLSWNSSVQSIVTKYAVSGSTLNITGAPDKNYAVIDESATCEVTDYQGGIGTIKQVYFNITYYGSVSNDLDWAYRLSSGGSWNTIGTLQQGGSASSPLTASYNATDLRAVWTWNNLNVTGIQFQNNDKGPPEQAYVDSIYVTLIVDVPIDYSTIQDATFTVEMLQNGNMRWLGQNLQLTTSAKPIPPVPIRGIHVNQTINNLNYEIPFQIEDWTSDCRIPQGLTSNASLLSSKNLLVFLVNPNVSKITVWWNASDRTTQTPYAIYDPNTSPFRNDDPGNGLLTNGILNLTIQREWEQSAQATVFKVTSIVANSTATARFMRINGQNSTYGADAAYVIHHGVVRDIIQQEAEWSDGVTNCSNLYAHIVLTLPANATYYTYQLRLMFIETQQNRNITDLCPIQLRTTISQLQTENGTEEGYPIISNTEGLFYNFSDGNWAHHWSQFVSGTKGAGIMFTDNANQQLYIFDTLTGIETGALKANSTENSIELLPVKMASVGFKSAFDVTWHGAVVTFDDTVPIYKEEEGIKTGLWVSVEYPPKIAVTTG